MSASFAAVIGIGALMAVSLLNENKVTGLLQKKVQGENLINLARETNESALSRTRSLLLPDGSLSAALKVLPNGQFVKASGAGFEVANGRLNLNTPQPPSEGWALSNQTFKQLNTALKIEAVTLDPSGDPAVIVVSATTTTREGEISKTISTKARFELAALGAPTGPGSVPVIPTVPVTSTSTTIASTPPPSDPCNTSLATPNAPTSIVTGTAGIANTAGLGIGNNGGVGIANVGAGIGIGNQGSGVGIGNNNGGIGIGNQGSGVGIGNTNGGIGIGNNGGIGIGSECGGIGINAPNGCIGIGLGGKSCLGIRYK